MSFLHPGWFWLMLLAVPLVAVHVRGRAGAAAWKTWLLAGLRVLGLLLLVTALARPVIHRDDPSTTTVLVADCSQSVSDAELVGMRQQIEQAVARRGANESVRLVTFDAAAREVPLVGRRELSLRDSAATTPATRPSDASGSALADALDLAGLLIRSSGRGRVVVFSDGRETTGDARAAAWRLAKRGVALQCNPVGAPLGGEALIKSLRLPATGGIGATVELTVAVEVSQPSQVVLEVRGDAGGEVLRSEHRLDAGSQELSIPLALQREGLCRYTVRLSAERDTSTENNELAAAIQVTPAIRVGVIEDNPTEAAAPALRALTGAAAEISRLDPADAGFAGLLSDKDVLVIADATVETIPAAAQAAIRDAVTRGMGLLMTGGRRAFGPARFADSPLAEVMPLRFPQGMERRDPSATVVIIIDTSGSMTGPRVSLAKEIARLALSRLKPHDKAGIVEFYGSKRWAAPIQSAANAIDLQRALNRLSAGGGTVILPAMEEAYYALQNVNTRTKHVLVLTDGGVETGAFEPLIRRMADHNITLSTVMVGPGAHSAFLASLAHWGRGRFYAAPDRFNLPEIIVKQPENSLSLPFVEQTARLVASRRHPLLDAIDLTSCPALTGYVESTARPTAETVLASDLGHPVLARWQYGLGSVAAWTSQLGGEWSGDVMQWSSAGRLFSKLLRSLAGVRPEQALAIRLASGAGGVELEVRNMLAATEAASAAIEVSVTRQDQPADDDGPERKWTLDPYAPHRWNLRIGDLEPGTYAVQARTLDGKRRGAAGLVVNEPRELASLAPDGRLLGDLVRIAGTPASVTGIAMPQKAVEVWPLFAALFVPLMLLHVLIRRWPSRVPTTPAAVAIAVLCALGNRPSTASAAAPGTSSPATATAAATAAWEQVAQARGLSGETVASLTTALAGNDAAADEAYEKAARACLTQLGTIEPLMETMQAATSSPRGAWLLARAARDAGQLTVARDTLAALAEREPGRFEVWAELARVEEWLGNDKGALGHIAKAMACPCEPAQKQALFLRAAAIHHDLGQAEALSGSLDAVLATAPGTPELRHLVGHYAAALGEADQAERYLVPQGGGKEQFHDHLLRGLVLLQLDRAEEARHEYERAYEMAPLDRDRRYALERVIASARRAGNLPELAREWQADPKLSPDRLQALVAVLSELGESQKLLDLLQRPTDSPEHRRLLESPEFQTQVVSAALGSGNSQQAEAAYRQLADRYPQQIQWRISLARLWLMDNKREQATQFLMEAVGQFDDSGGLMALAEAASRVSLEEVALAASDKAASMGLPQQIRSGLFQAGLVRQRGKSDEAIARVRKLIPVARKDPKLLQSVAETLERYGDKAEALRLLKELYDATGAEDTLLQVGYLLEENQKHAEAYELWSRLWSTTQVAARLKQAENRMLDLASKTGKLADLVIDIEERIGAGKANERELKLLIQIYTTAQDPVSAAEILQEYAARSGSEVGLLKGLAKVYLDCEQFGRCNTTLRRLVELDPENATDYLQQIAILAMERKQPMQARKVLAELRARTGNDEMTDEFAAGVMDMTGQHEEAARAYQRVLNRHPDRIESWLLWGNAMKACGRTEAAVARFQALVEESAEDDLFTVAVDGLLNLEAKPAVLRSALRRVFGRIAAAPQKVFLYQLANDLLDALNETGQAREVLEQSVVVGGERRSAILRELMDSAKSANDLKKQVEYGRSLVALGDELPPLVFLDLGDALLKQGQLHLAERVFERASIDGEYSAIQQRVATCYEDVNMTADADRIIRGLLMAEPDNVPLLVRSGALNEQMGNHEQAFAQYYRAADLMLRRLPGCAQGEASRPAESERSRNRVARASNVDEITQYFESAGNGLIGTARTPALRDRLQRDLLRRIDEELSFLSANRRLMPRLSGNPRLERLARFLRQVAFSLHVPDIADKVDRDLLSRYPNDAELRRLVVTSRAEWGLHKRAVAFGGQAAAAPPRKTSRPASRPAVSRPASGPGDPVRIAGAAGASAEVNIDLVLADLKLADPLIAGKTVSAELAYRLVPALMMSGKTDQARQVLACAPPAEGKELAAHCSRMMAAAIALEDTEAVQRWLGLWLERAVSLRDPQNPTAAASSMERCVRMGFRVLDQAQRFGMLERLNRLLPRLDSRNQLALRFLQLEICDSLGAPYEGLEQLARDAAKETRLLSEEVVRLLEHLDAANRIEFLRAAIAARKPEEQRGDLLTLLGLLSKPSDPAFREAFLQIMEAAPKRRLNSGDIRLWPRNGRQPELVLAVAEKLLTESPDSPVVLVAAAMARETAGRYEEAMALVREALELLSAARQATMEEGTLIGLALEVMRPAELQAYATALAEQYEIEAPTPLQTFTLGLVLDATGRESEAIAAYRKAYEAQPANRTFSRKLIMTLKQTGRTVELARTLAATLTSSTMMESFEWRSLSEAYYDLYDPIASLQAARKDETIISPVSQMRATRLMGRHAEALSIFRRSFISNRDKGFYIDLTWPLDSSPGGLIGFQPDLEEAWSTRRKMFEAMADLPWAEEEYTALLQAARPGRRDIEGLIAGLITAARSTQGWERLAKPLEAARKAEAITVRDHALLVELALNHPACVSDELLKEIDGGRAHLDPAESKPLFALARVYQSRGRPQAARGILLWLLAGGLEGVAGLPTTQRLAHLDAYVATLPETERLAALRRWLGIMQPTALDPLTNEFGMECVDRLAAAGDERWRDQLELLRKRADSQPADPRYRSLRVALAQRYAALGEREIFAEQSTRVLDPAAMGDVYGRVLDIRNLLPATLTMSEPLTYVDILEARLQKLHADGDLTSDDLIRSLCLLADWCREQKLPDKAAVLVSQAEAAMGEPDSVWLFVGDVLRRLGHEARPREIEARLLEKELMPVSRVPGLLNEIEKAQGQAAADQLALKAATYSSHPDILRRAIRQARSAGDEAAATGLQNRLEQVRPDPPRVSTRAASAPALAQ